MKIVYTPLHGTGNIPVRRMLEGMDVTVVKEQELPDGNFSTVRSPNPEEKDALNIAIETAKKIGADLVLGTDPDCDRVGIAVKDGDDYKLFTGNQTGALLVKFILTMHKDELNPNQHLLKQSLPRSSAQISAENSGLMSRKHSPALNTSATKSISMKQAAKRNLLSAMRSHTAILSAHTQEIKTLLFRQCSFVKWRLGIKIKAKHLLTV